MAIEKKNAPSIEKKNDKYKDDFSFMDDDKAFNDPYYLDAALKKEIEEKDIVVRFLNEPKMKKFGGRHQSGWKVYKRESRDQTGLLDGDSPDGCVRRGSDLILGYMPREYFDKLRKRNRVEAATMSVKGRIERQKKDVERTLRANRAKGMTVVDESEIG